ncbi:sulfite exporter TauE/SafE family protein [Ancylobacter mangrovi]|uniref:sulfite exporter TauE/SafE family protein n=1 Tax=Ancylobacter mangrovi TaxID=2972472 RepID=UPI002163FA4C|nr:sulfite exporter TauE/SafE family protein [Ancylobacter mangrovi]MCS0503900.1 sulfite exporter TauE/SafE family protein [Ancylobacter mangrovi]
MEARIDAPDRQDYHLRAPRPAGMRLHIGLPMSFDPVLAGALLTALVAGTTRGFAGFGGALIFVPLISAAYGPRVSAPTLLIVDTALTLPFVIRAFRDCVWRQVAPLAIGAVVAVPAGVAILRHADPLALRWALAGLGLAMLAPVMAGWRHSGQQRLPSKLALGAFAGVLGGAAQMSGPPLVAYWLGSNQPPALVRANMFGFFALVTVASATAYAANGMLTREVGWLVLVLGPAYAAGLFLGARAFRGTSDRNFRFIAYWIITLALLLSLPVFDTLLGR